FSAAFFPVPRFSHFSRLLRLFSVPILISYFCASAVKEIAVVSNSSRMSSQFTISSPRPPDFCFSRRCGSAPYKKRPPVIRGTFLSGEDLKSCRPGYISRYIHYSGFLCLVC